MHLEQFFVKGLAHSSYLLGDGDTCAVIDPRRDIEIYLDAAKKMDMSITHILETHLHADFISGHMDLAQATGARIYLPKAGEGEFEHVPLAEGDSVAIGNLDLRVLEIPGHTPEHISYVVIDRARGEDPVGVFCGDTLFVGDVGRPDLFPGQAETLASQLFDSLHSKLLQLPDFCEIYPAHGAGSLCGRAMGVKRTSTIGYERKYNAALQISDRQEFIHSLVQNMPGTPDHFGRCSNINRKGPAPIYSLTSAASLSPSEFNKQAENPNSLVLDIRDYESFGGKHIPKSWHIDFRGNFSTFAGWILPPKRDILLVASDSNQVGEATVLLRRVGLDHVIGYLEGGLFEWAVQGLPIDHVPQISVQKLNQLATGDDSFALVDARAPEEYDAYHIRGAVNIPFADMRERYRDLDPRVSTVVICGTGQRSSLAAAILKQKGFSDVLNAAGGMNGYTAAGFAPECPVCVLPHGPRYVGQKTD